VQVEVTGGDVRVPFEGSKHYGQSKRPRPFSVASTSIFRKFRPFSSSGLEIKCAAGVPCFAGRGVVRRMTPLLSNVSDASLACSGV